MDCIPSCPTSPRREYISRQPGGARITARWVFRSATVSGTTWTFLTELCDNRESKQCWGLDEINTEILWMEISMIKRSVIGCDCLDPMLLFKAWLPIIMLLYRQKTITAKINSLYFAIFRLLYLSIIILSCKTQWYRLYMMYRIVNCFTQPS